MRKLFLILVVAVLIAPTAAEARHSGLHRLQVKVAKLQTKVNRLHLFTHNCLGWDWVPLASYGDPAGTFGYAFDDGTDAFFSTALDFADRPEDTDFVTVAVNPACLSQVAARPTALRMKIQRLARAK